MPLLEVMTDVLGQVRAEVLGGVEAVGELGDEAFDDLPPAVVLALEVEIERALGDAGARGDVLDLGRREPVLGEHGLGGAEQLDLGAGVGDTGHC